MLQIRNLHYSIGARELLSGINWVIQSGRRAALIGPNGAGKTTLFRILNGEVQYQSGQILKPKEYRIGYLPQEELSLERGSILEIALEGEPEIMALEEKIHDIRTALESPAPNSDDLLLKLGNYEHRYETLGGYQAESRAKAILSGLGFKPTDFHRPLRDFSGGWRMRAYLSRLLLQKPDLLLLDEPTNHLDLPSLEWLEEYLLDFPGSMIIVSHDRFFIDRLAHEIFELNHGKMDHYAGNYHFYEQEKVSRYELLEKKQEEIRQEREKQQRFIDRFRYKATKAVQVQSRIKQLEKLPEIDLPPAPPPRIHFRLSVHQSSYKDTLKIENLSFRYDQEWVLENIRLNIYRGDRIALVGVNGAGKTTMTRLIVGQLQPQIGSLVLGPRTTIGYYAQHQIDTLNLDNTAYDEVAATVADSHIPRIRDVLGLFQISGDAVFKKVRVLSGGEKARVSLAKILISPVNFLIMDEPTNHLDMASKEALEDALAKFDGTCILISHDRYFLDRLVKRVIELKDKHLYEYEGNYSDYLERRRTVENQPMPLKEMDMSPSRRTKEQKRLEAEARQAISKERNRLKEQIEKVESRISQLEIRKGEVESLLSKPETYQDSGLASSLPKEYGSLKDELARSYEQWELASKEYDKLLKSMTK
jgi:ATP-binding cassette, subfamily F, member 3